jgi:hypothetical protein
MAEPSRDITEVRSLRGYFREAWRRHSAGRRPLSLYLLLAIILVLLLGTQMFEVLADPVQFAFFLTVLLVFLFLVIYLAITECAAILRGQVGAQSRAYQDTLGEDAFVSDLRTRLREDDEE